MREYEWIVLIVYAMGFISGYFIGKDNYGKN